MAEQQLMELLLFRASLQRRIGQSFAFDGVVPVGNGRRCSFRFAKLGG
jgi:hypothetical protein